VTLATDPTAPLLDEMLAIMSKLQRIDEQSADDSTDHRRGHRVSCDHFNERIPMGLMGDKDCGITDQETHVQTK